VAVDRSCIVVFGREPVPGRGKSRLADTIGDAAAARVSAVLLQHTLAEARATGLEFCLALADPPGPGFTDPGGAEVLLQGDGDLGARMEGCFADRFAAGYTRVVLVGTDIPGLRRHHLLGARGQLTAVQAVLGPARDGGYYLVAQRAPGADLFQDIPWSTPQTMAATRRRIERLGLFHREIETLEDLDTDADLDRALDDPTLLAPLREALREAKEGPGS
jgi:uncharacterized protein